MRRALQVLVFLGVLAMAGGTALAHDFRDWNRGREYGRYPAPYHRDPRPPAVQIVRPPVIVAPRPYYEPWSRPWCRDPNPHGVLRYYSRGWGLTIAF